MSRTSVVVEGRTLSLSNLDKVLYPEAGFTKAHVIDYYRRVAPVLLPHLRDRPLTMKRYPEGVDAEFFYEKECPPYRPDFIGTAPLWSERKQADTNFCVVNDLPGIVWIANLADLELHTNLHRRFEQESPDFVAFDLDPGAPAALLECCRAALRLRAALAEDGLSAYPKVSGGKGMQVYVPLNSGETYDRTKPYARAMAERLERETPGEVTSNMRKALRPGKIFVDWSQNDQGKTTVCVYSLRARARPTVSTPLRWPEVEDAVAREDASGLVFGPDDALRRVEQEGDLFRPVLGEEQRLP